MIEAVPLKRGDRVAIVSLSSGMLGEGSCSHDIELGTRRLKEFGLTPVFMPNALKGEAYLSEHPEKRAEDLKAAFLDDSIRGVICAIGGDDTYRLLPFLMEDSAFKAAVTRAPKLFTGFSDATVNHLMFRRLGLQTFYGPCFICDLAELADEMLPYTKAAFQDYFRDYRTWKIRPSPVWYEERLDFSAAAAGTQRPVHEERRGYELLQGPGVFEGELLGGCLESLYDMLASTRHEDEGAVCSRYGVFPSREEWQGKILFVETCEEKPSPALLRRELEALADAGVFAAVSGVIVGKPQDERYYDEYKDVFRSTIADPALPVLYNVNFGHAYPRTALPYGARARADAERQLIEFVQ